MADGDVGYAQIKEFWIGKSLKFEKLVTIDVFVSYNDTKA